MAAPRPERGEVCRECGALAGLVVGGGFPWALPRAGMFKPFRLVGVGLAKDRAAPAR